MWAALLGAALVTLEPLSNTWAAGGIEAARPERQLKQGLPQGYLAKPVPERVWRAFEEELSRPAPSQTLGGLASVESLSQALKEGRFGLRPPHSLGTVSEAFANLPNLDRERPRVQLKHAQARKEFHQAVTRPGTTRDDMKTALQRLINRTTAQEAGRAVRDAMADVLKAGNEVTYPPLDPTVPSLRVRRPSNDSWDPLVDYLLKGAVKRRLDAKIENQRLLLLPLVYSSDGKAKLRSIPRHQLTPDGLADRLAAWDPSKDDPKLRAELHGRIIVVIGHIVGEGPEQAFEIQHGNGQTSQLAISRLDDATRLGAQFLLLGCETTQSSAIGTAAKINDLDAIAASQRALAKRDLATWKDLLAVLGRIW